MTHPDTAEVERVAKALTKAQRVAVAALDSEWSQGPSLPETVIDHLYDLRVGGLVERYFADMHEPRIARTDASISVRLGACWHFRLSDLGLAVRTHLEGAKP